MPRSSRPHVPAGRTPVIPRVPWLLTSPPCSRGLRCCNVPYSSEPRLPAREVSGTTTCPANLDSTSLLGRAPALSRAPWLRTLPPYSGGLQHCHVPQTSGIKKCLAGLDMQLGLCVAKTRSHITKAPSPNKHCKTGGLKISLRHVRRVDVRT
jgi:hypothetical protein